MNTKHAMGDSRVLRKLKKLASMAIDVLKKSRGACRNYEAGTLRKNLKDILDKKKEKAQKALIHELASALEEVGKYAKDPIRSYKSEYLRNLREEISNLLQSIGWKTKNITEKE